MAWQAATHRCITTWGAWKGAVEAGERFQRPGTDRRGPRRPAAIGVWAATASRVAMVVFIALAVVVTSPGGEPGHGAGVSRRAGRGCPV